MLPQVKSESVESEEGKRKHAVVEKYFKGGRKEAEDFTEEDKLLCRRIANTIGPVWELGEKSEFRFLLDLSDGRPDSIRFYGDAEEPSEAERSTGIYGIADLVSLKDGGCSVWDWKSGSSYVPDPEWNWQLLLPAIAVWVNLGTPDSFSAELGILYCSESKLNSDGTEYLTKRFTANADLLRARLGWLRRALGPVVDSRVRPDNVTLYEGKHCEYCPARHRCPAKVGALAAAVQYVDPKETKWDKETVRVAMTLVECGPQIKKTAINIVKEHGNVLDLGDGREAVVLDKGGKSKIYTRKKSQLQDDSKSDVGVDGAE